jgi:hypothetical protein
MNLKQTSYSQLSHDVAGMFPMEQQRVFFSIFETLNEEVYEEGNAAEWQVRYPDIHSSEPAIPGNCKLVIKENSKEFFSEPLHDPTWTDVLQNLNTLLGKTDSQIGFLEAIMPLDAGVYEAQFSK